MLTTLEIISLVYSVLHTDGVTNIYKHSKPLNEVKSEYVVINAVSADAEQLQETQINVNYHCDDTDKARRIPNTTKLLAGASAVIGSLHDHYDDNIDATLIFQAGPIQNPDIAEHYINLRFTIRNIN